MAEHSFALKTTKYEKNPVHIGEVLCKTIKKIPLMPFRREGNFYKLFISQVVLSIIFFCCQIDMENSFLEDTPDKLCVAAFSEM